MQHFDVDKLLRDGLREHEQRLFALLAQVETERRMIANYREQMKSMTAKEAA